MLTKDEKKVVLKRGHFGMLMGMLMIMFITVEFICVGLPLNLIQVLLYYMAKLYPQGSESRRKMKKLNGYLIYLMFSGPLTIIYYWLGGKIDVFANNKETRDLIVGQNESRRDDENISINGKQKISARPQLILGVFNHSYELDYMTSILMMDQFGQLSNFKFVVKHEVIYIPVVGSSMQLSDIIFVKRDWTKDRLSLGEQLNKLLDYKRCTLAIFPEGTRFSCEKLSKSRDYAIKTLKVEPLRHHLWPKTRGFSYTLCDLIRKTKAMDMDLKLLNVECIMRQKCDFNDFLMGRPLSAELFCEEVKLNDQIVQDALASGMEANFEETSAMKQLLVDIFRRKDDIVDLYHDQDQDENNTQLRKQFPLRIPLNRNHWSSYNLAFGATIWISCSVYIIQMIPWSPISLGLTILITMLSSTLLFIWILHKSRVHRVVVKS